MSEQYADVVEAGRELTISVTLTTGMIKLQINAERRVARDGSFLLDSEDVDNFCASLRAARDAVWGLRR